MESNEEIFYRICLEVNKEFNHDQFKRYNIQLHKIIIKAMNECQKPLRAKIKEQKTIIDDDKDYLIMRRYAQQLEVRLGINQEHGK